MRLPILNFILRESATNYGRTFLKTFLKVSLDTITSSICVVKSLRFASSVQFNVIEMVLMNDFSVNNFLVGVPYALCIEKK